MKQVIPFSKDIVFKTDIAIINSISLDHHESVINGEICGEFIIYGDYKVHNDTTELVEFNYKLPFSTLLADNIVEESVVLDIDNFTFEIIEDDVLRVNIDFFINADIIQDSDSLLEDIDKEIDEILRIEDSEILENDRLEEDVLDNELEELVLDNEDIVIEDKEVVEKEEYPVKEEIVLESHDIEEEYVTYHVHIVKENETIEQIIKMYGVSLELLKDYNTFNNVKNGDKLIIPEYCEDEL